MPYSVACVDLRHCWKGPPSGCALVSVKKTELWDPKQVLNKTNIFYVNDYCAVSYCNATANCFLNPEKGRNSPVDRTVRVLLWDKDKRSAVPCQAVEVKVWGTTALIKRWKKLPSCRDWSDLKPPRRVSMNTVTVKFKTSSFFLFWYTRQEYAQNWYLHTRNTNFLVKKKINADLHILHENFSSCDLDVAQQLGQPFPMPSMFLCKQKG